MNKVKVSDEPIKVGDKVLCLESCYFYGNPKWPLRIKGKVYETCEMDIEDMEGNVIGKTWGYINEDGQKQSIMYPEEMKKVIDNSKNRT